MMMLDNEAMFSSNQIDHPNGNDNVDPLEAGTLRVMGGRDE